MRDPVRDAGGLTRAARSTGWWAAARTTPRWSPRTTVGRPRSTAPTARGCRRGGAGSTRSARTPRSARRVGLVDAVERCGGRGARATTGCGTLGWSSASSTPAATPVRAVGVASRTGLAADRRHARISMHAIGHDDESHQRSLASAPRVAPLSTRDRDGAVSSSRASRSGRAESPSGNDPKGLPGPSHAGRTGRRTAGPGAARGAPQADFFFLASDSRGHQGRRHVVVDDLAGHDRPWRCRRARARRTSRGGGPPR